MVQDLLNRHPVDLWPGDGHPENHGAAPPGQTQSPGKLRQGWRDSLGTELQEPQAVPLPDTLQGHSTEAPTVRASTARPLCHPVLPLWLRAAINTAQQDGDPWQLQKPGESTLQQPCWCRKYEILFLGEKNLKSRNSQERETVSMKLRWRECIGNLGTRRSFAILSVYFPCTESWFLAKKKITDWGN